MMYGMYGGYSMGCPSRTSGITMEMKRGQNATKASNVKTPQENKNNTGNIDTSNEKQWHDQIEPGGGWRPEMEYEGDGNDQIEFFKAQGHSKLIDSMNEHEIRMFKDWTEGDFMPSSRAAEIYGDEKNWSTFTKQHAKVYDKFLDKAELKQGIRVVRRSDAQLLFGKDNKRVSSLAQLKAMEGRTIESKAYMSSGAAETGLGIGDTSKQIDYVMHIPKSTGAGMWVGHHTINGWGARQREFMINRKSLWKVGKITFDKSSNKYRVEMYWLGRTV